eukprot:5734356-Prymnesium_polylepis.1
MVHGATSSEHISHVTTAESLTESRSDSESIGGTLGTREGPRHQRCVWYLYTIESVPFTPIYTIYTNLQFWELHKAGYMQRAETWDEDDDFRIVSVDLQSSHQTPVSRKTGPHGTAQPRTWLNKRRTRPRKAKTAPLRARTPSPPHGHPVRAAVGARPQAPVRVALDDLRTAEDAARVAAHGIDDLVAHPAQLVGDGRVDALLERDLSGRVRAVGDAVNAEARR